MRAVLWEIIQKNWPLLVSELGPQADHIAAILFEREVLTPDDKENVSKKKTSKQKVTTLLNILRNKPEHANAFEELIEAVKRDKALSHVVEALENTTVTSSSHFVTKGDPGELEEPVRKVLLQKYSNRPGKTKLSDILLTLQQNVKCQGGFNWNNDQLSKFISEVFANVSVKSELNPASGRKTKYVINLIPIESSQINNENTNYTLATLAAQKPAVSNTEIESPNNNFQAESKHVGETPPDLSKVTNYSSKELRLYLNCFFEEKQLSTDLPTEFEKHQITGEVFLTLTKSEIEEISPSSGFGIVKTLTMLINRLNSQVLSTQPTSTASVVTEKLRDFNCEASDSDCYVQGRFIDVRKSQTLKKLVPLHYFCLLKEVDFQSNEQLAYEMLSSKAIQFISGCLNNRQNGTIYFGIDPESGLIEGLPVEMDKVLNYINYYIEKAFPDENLKNAVKNVLQPQVGIPVSNANFEKTGNFVVEIDVVPSSPCIQGTKLQTKIKKLKYLPASAKKSRTFGYFSLDENGEPILIGHDKLQAFFNQVDIASQLRKTEEEMVCAASPENLRQKLLNLLTGGREKLEDVIYPFIVLSTIDALMDKNYITRNLQFIKHLDTDVVFDFDPTGSMKGVYHCYDSLQGELMTVLTLDNFVCPVNSKFIESIDTDKLSWVFCNGYDPSSIKPRSPTEWNKQIRSAFQKALKHFEKNRSKDRIIVIICLFSKDYETMLEGCDEILTSFPNQWVVYAESESIAEMWKKEMIQRKKIDQKDAFQRVLVSMTWEQINDTIAQVTHQADTKGCILPQAAGTFTKPIPEKKLKSWCDIELLSSADPNVSEDLSKKVMESFYKGESVDWLNFWFEGQVLKRSLHTLLLELVEKALTEEEENKISTVILFHHPGSGATTSAKQVLWELRKKYRCCVIRKITEDTVDQLIEIRHFSEPKSPKPILILVDNEDAEKYRQLKKNLEMKCKDFHRDNGDAYKVYFTMLFCIRKAILPQQILSNQMLLEQKLTKQEEKLFGKKHKQLTSDFEKNNENIDPKFLISFNILKNDFNRNYILKSVTEFIKGVKDEREQTLLCYIALLNKYDPLFRSIPVSCFDPLFNKKLETSSQRGTNWEANLSQAVQVLLSISPQKKSGRTNERISLRVIHRLVADSLLENLITSKNSLNDIMLKLINSVIFDQDTEDMTRLEYIVGDIMKKREFNEEHGKKKMFSPFITQVKKDCGEEVSIKLLCDLFDRNHDPFIAQLIARFFYHLKNWGKAEFHAQKATDLKPECSDLWDTFGQVYRAQLIDVKDNVEKQMDKTKKLDNNFVTKLIALAQKAIFYFKKAQEINEQNSSDINENNVAGYFGELKTQIMLLRLLEKCQCFKNRGHLAKCLVSKDFSEYCFRFLRLEDKCFLTELEDNCMKTLRVLDEQYLQVREDTQFDVAVYSGTFGRDLENLMFSFHDYFGAPNDFAYVKKLPEPEASMHRWRIALKLGAMSLNILLRFRADALVQALKDTNEKNQYAQNLITIYQLLLPNVSSENCEYNYLLGMLNAITLIVVDKLFSKCRNISYTQILDLSKKLLECKQPNERRAFVEPLMYFVMFNFPSETRDDLDLCTVKKLQEACDKWTQTYVAKFKNAEARTLFYLAKGELLMDLVHSDTFPMKGRDNWDDPEMRKYLALYPGTVEIGGKRVNVKITRDDNTLHLSIPTSYTVKKNLWQRETYFFIGFSFSGPKAYGIPQAPPEMDVPMASKCSNQEKNPSNSRSIPQPRGVS